MGRVRILATTMAILATTISVRAEEQLRSSKPAAAEQPQPVKFVRCTGHDRNVYSVVLTPDGKFAVSGGEDPYLIVWNTEDGSEVRRILRHGPNEKAGAAYDLKLSPDGTKVGALASGQRIQFWDIATGEPDKESYPLDAPTIHWALSGDRMRLARSALSDVSITDLKQNKVIWTKQFPPDEVGLVNSVAFSPDGQRLGVALRFDGRGRLVKSNLGKVQVWDFKADKDVFSTWPLATYVNAVAFSLNNELFAAGTFKLEVWNSATFKSLFSLPPEKSPSRHFPIASLAFNAKGTRIATGGSDGAACIWNAADGKMLFKLQGASGEVRAVNFSGDETKLAVVGSDKTVLIWLLPPEVQEGIQDDANHEKE